MSDRADQIRMTAKKIASVLPGTKQLMRRVKDLQARNDALVAAILDVPSWCAEAASRYDVTSAVHRRDFIFQHILRTRGVDVRGAVNEYFDTGLVSANKLRSLISTEIDLESKPARLLEFASGYGCVSRHLAKWPDEIDLVACDIHDEAKAFYSEYLGAPFIKSERVPEEFDAPSDFDVVFALSFFSHMPETSWARWLKVLFQHVGPKGHLIFTTHGMVSHALIRKPRLSQNGFWFKPVSEQSDLATHDYGNTVTLPSFVKSEIAKLSDARLVLFREGDWWGHQDLYVVQRQSSSQTRQFGGSTQ